jgi:hypothetical protein
MGAWCQCFAAAARHHRGESGVWVRKRMPCCDCRSLQTRNISATAHELPQSPLPPFHSPPLPCFRPDPMADESPLQPESLVRVHRAALLAWDYATPHNRGSAHGLRINPLPQTCCVDHTPPPLSAQAQNRGQGITSSVGIAPLRRPINGAGFARSIARGDGVLALLAGEELREHSDKTKSQLRQKNQNCLS